VYGAQGQIRPVPQVEVGAAASRDDDPLAGTTLVSGNAAIDVAKGLTVLGEVAHSDSGDATGNAMRGEIRYGDRGVDLSAFAMETGTSFSNPSSGFGPGRTELGVRGGWSPLSRTRLFGEGLLTRDRITGGRRHGVQLG